LIKGDGWNIADGPHLNSVLLGEGIFVVSIKSVMGKKELEARKIAWDKSSLPGSKRTVRFLLDVSAEGQVTAAHHITSSQRKRLGRIIKTPARVRRRKQRKAREEG
jgi:hypothetical protein